MFLTVFLACLVLGCVAGLLAGLLGIGGGLIIVPVLLTLFQFMNVPLELSMPMALATSLASIFFTSISAVFSHHKYQNIPWKIAKNLLVFVSVGGLIGSYLVSMLTVTLVINIFAGAVIVLAAYMLFSVKLNMTRRAPKNTIVYSFIGIITGIISSLMGIAGGAILVPVLTYFSIPIRQAMGVATVCGIAVAVFGASGFVLTGFALPSLPPYSLGYIYLPALLGIILSSTSFVKIGVTLAKHLPVLFLKKLFALFLICVAINMLLT